MRVLSVLLTFAAIASAQSVQDPAKLEVIESGVLLSYKVIDQSPYRIVGFEIYTQLTSDGFEGLGCGVGAEVKSAKDLSVTDVCQLPIDEKTGKPVTYSSRIVRVNFANGLTWTPAKESQSKNANPQTGNPNLGTTPVPQFFLGPSLAQFSQKSICEPPGYEKARWRSSAQR